MLAEQLGVFQAAFPCGYMPWERFKRSENECRMNWMIGRWSETPKHMPNSACQTKKKVVPASDWQAMKSRSIFRILNARNLGLISPTINIFLKTKSLRTDDDGCVWWDQESVIYELLKPGETVNAHRYHQQLIKLRARACVCVCVCVCVYVHIQFSILDIWVDMLVCMYYKYLSLFIRQSKESYHVCAMSYSFIDNILS